MGRLAINGGVPIRTKEFRSIPHIDENEINAVIAVLQSKELSGFVGSPHNDIEKMLTQTSDKLNKYFQNKTFLGGNRVRELEAIWAKMLDVKYCISVNSATSGLITAILATIGKGVKIITTPFSFTATVGAILAANCTPIFCDIDIDTFCLSPEALMDVKGGSGIIPVHWCGNAGDFDELIKVCDKRFPTTIIEDTAQAPLTKYGDKYLGTFGEVGVFSLNEPKNIQSGEGGLVVTNSEYVAKRCRLIRNHGENIVDSKDIGYNFRLTEIQAAIAIEQIKKAHYANIIRHNNWECLRDEVFSNFGEFIIPQKITHETTFNAYTAAFRFIGDKVGISRDLFAKALIAEGVPVSTGMHRLLCDHELTKNSFATVPNARKLNKQYLGFFQTGWPNTQEDMSDIINTIKKIMDNKGELHYDCH